MQSTGTLNSCLSRLIPSQERLERGAIAVIECFQNIPCDPCRHSCPRGAILPMKDINEIPRLDPEKCNGCGRCAARCPGLAIFVVDCSCSLSEAMIKLPYEFLPRPLPATEVETLDRNGKKVGRGTVVKVQESREWQRTALVWLAVPKQDFMRVRNFRFQRSGKIEQC